MSDKIIQLTDDSFEADVINASGPVLVDFWAEWCGPCRMVGPLVEEIANEYKGKFLVGKVNVDHNAAISAKYGIRNIPTILFIKNGEVVDKVVGAASKTALVEKVEAHL